MTLYAIKNMNLSEISYTRLFSHLNRVEDCFAIYDLFRADKDKVTEYDTGGSGHPNSADEDYMLELVDSVERLTVYFRCPLSRLKKTAIERARIFCARNGEPVTSLVESLGRMSRSETLRFGIHECNTATYLLRKWVADNIAAENSWNNIIGKLSQKYGMRREKSESELNIATASLDENSIERRLFSLAKQCADYIGYCFMDFPDKGFFEALLYCTTLIIDIGTEHGNNINQDTLEDRYFVLLADEIISVSESSVNTIEFINSRIKLYRDCPEEMLYGLFFLSPFWETPDKRKWKSITAADLKKLRRAVRHVRKMISKENIVMI